MKFWILHKKHQVVVARCCGAGLFDTWYEKVDEIEKENERWLLKNKNW